MHTNIFIYLYKPYCKYDINKGLLLTTTFISKIKMTLEVENKIVGDFWQPHNNPHKCGFFFFF